MEFQGFDASELEPARRQYADEAKARWGHTDAWQASQEKTEDWAAQAEGMNDIFRRAAALRRSLTAEACAALGRARELHDALEAEYHPFVDFRALTRFEKKHLEKTFSA